MPLDDLFEGVDTVFHLAARPGVRDSWTDFEDYARSNVVGTKRVLDACAGRSIRLVFASSSSVYGNSDRLPAEEDFPPMPVSPYGATKVMTEVLASAYVRGHGMDVVGLRYFTVYGPRQRPDMAIARFIESAAVGAPIHVYGDGRQLRDMTFVTDAVGGTIAAAEKGRTGEIYNLGSGQARPLLEILGELERALGAEIEIEHEGEKLGDVRDTWASIAKAQDELGFEPATGLAEGLAQQVADAERRRGVAALSR
jgi:nucleoside-diphosphate-sugar epimerase